jgi:hypothetical protein
MRKFVELDGEFGGMLEVDKVKLQRTAKAFKDWLLAIDPSNDPFGFIKEDLPIVEAVLNNTLTLPYLGYKPHNWEIRERLVSDEYLEISSPFYNTIRGGLYEPPEVIMQDGRYYTWVDFEDESA